MEMEKTKSALVKHRYKLLLSLCAFLFFADLYSSSLAFSVTKTREIIHYEGEGFTGVYEVQDYAREENAFFRYLLVSLGDVAYPVGFAIMLGIAFFIYGLHRIYEKKGLPYRVPVEVFFALAFTGVIVTRTLIVHNNLTVYLELIS